MGEMRRLGFYIFGRTAVLFVASLATLTAIVWVTQALRRFDLVTAKGQAIMAYLAMTFLAVPYLVVVVAPFALVIAMAIVLNAMHADSELVAINAAGGSQRQVLVPFLSLSLIVAAVLAWLSLFAGPQALQALRDMTNSVRADIVANVIQPGRFVDLEDGITFHIRNRAGDGSLEGLFIRDGRDPAFVFTYTAERGRVVETLGRTLVVMENGTVERDSRENRATTFVAFGSYAFDLSDLQPNGQPAPYKVGERTIADLITTPKDDPYRRSREDQFASEIHVRLSAILYPVSMALTAFVFLGLPRTTRTGRSLAVIGALAGAALVRLAGFGAAGLAGANAAFIPLLYAVPVGVMFVAGLSIHLGVQPFVPAPVANAMSAVGDRIAALAARLAGGRPA
jgi:lipopolysaccharide export system permease protein